MFWRGSFRDGTVSHLPFCPKTDVCLCWFHVFEFLFAVFAFLHLTQAQNEAFRDGFVMNEDAVLNEGTGCAGRMRSDRLWFRSMIQSHDTDETLCVRSVSTEEFIFWSVLSLVTYGQVWWPILGICAMQITRDRPIYRFTDIFPDI